MFEPLKGCCNGCRIQAAFQAKFTGSDSRAFRDKVIDLPVRILIFHLYSYPVDRNKGFCPALPDIGLPEVIFTLHLQ